MTRRMRLGAVVVVTYVSARLLVRLLTTGAITVEASFLAELVIVPAVQIAILQVIAARLWPGALSDGDSCAS
jgi:hypothetical protein